MQLDLMWVYSQLRFPCLKPWYKIHHCPQTHCDSPASASSLLWLKQAQLQTAQIFSVSWWFFVSNGRMFKKWYCGLHIITFLKALHFVRVNNFLLPMSIWSMHTVPEWKYFSMSTETKLPVFNTSYVLVIHVILA